MTRELASDYAAIIKLDLGKELLPIHQSVDEMLTRLEEFETLMNVVENRPKNGADSSSGAYDEVLKCKPEIDTLSARVNYLHIFVNKANTDLTLLERQVEAAETQLGIPDTTIRGLLKPLLVKISKDQSPRQRDARSSLNYTRPALFRTSDYFPQDGSDDT